MTVRAGIVVTGTEVLTGRITDRNGPWVAERLFALGVDVAHITVCGDRPEDLAAELRVHHLLAVADAQHRHAGIGDGTGRLRGRRIQVSAGGRGPSARPRTAQLWLPAPGGGVAEATPIAPVIELSA